MADPTKPPPGWDTATPVTASEFEAASPVAETTVAKEPVSKTTSFLRGSAQGATLGFGDEIEGLIQAAFPVPGDAAAFKDRYRRQREGARIEDATAAADNPKSFLGGQMVGGIVTAAAPGAASTRVLGAGAPAAGALGRFISGARTAAPIGAAMGVGSSQSDLTTGDVAGVAADAALSGVTAAGISGLVAAAAPSLADFVRRKSVEYGRKVLSGISTPLSYTRKPIPEPSVNAAYEAGAIRPLGTTTGTAERLEVAVDKQAAIYNAIIDRLEQAGVTGPNARELAKRLTDRALREEPMLMGGDPTPQVLRRGADRVMSNADPYTGGYDPSLGLSQARAMTGSAQKTASGEYAKIPNRVSQRGDANMALAGELRQALEDAVAAQAGKAPAEAAAFLPEKEKLSNLLWALQEAREGAGKAARRGPLGLTDIVMAAPQVATGNLGSAAATLGVTKTLVPRIASTMGWSYRKAEALLRALSQAESGRGASALTPAAREELSRLGAFLRAQGRPGLATSAADDAKE